MKVKIDDKVLLVIPCKKGCNICRDLIEQKAVGRVYEIQGGKVFATFNYESEGGKIEKTAVSNPPKYFKPYRVKIINWRERIR